MALKFISHGEMVTTAKNEGYAVDDSVPTDLLREILGGILIDPGVPTPFRNAAVEMQAFVQQYRHQLNLECAGICVACAEVVMATCYEQLPLVRKEIDEENFK